MGRGGQPWFCRGDLNAFWALFADNLANMIIIAGVMTGVFQIPRMIHASELGFNRGPVLQGYVILGVVLGALALFSAKKGGAATEGQEASDRPTRPARRKKGKKRRS